MIPPIIITKILIIIVSLQQCIDSIRSYTTGLDCKPVSNPVNISKVLLEIRLFNIQGKFFYTKIHYQKSNNS